MKTFAGVGRLRTKWNGNWMFSWLNMDSLQIRVDIRNPPAISQELIQFLPGSGLYFRVEVEGAWERGWGEVVWGLMSHMGKETEKEKRDLDTDIPRETLPKVCFDSLFFFLNKFIYLFLAALSFVAARGFSLAAMSGSYSSLQCVGFSLQWLLLLRSTGSRHAGFSSCGTRAQ